MISQIISLRAVKTSAFISVLKLYGYFVLISISSYMYSALAGIFQLT